MYKRQVSIGDYSKELCGGTHVANTATIETIEIVSEESVSAGVRRIVAYTGAKAKDNQTQLMASATALAKKLGVSVSGLPLAAATLSKLIKGLKKQLSTGVEFKLDSVPATAKGAEPTDYFAVRDVMRKVAEALSTTVNDAHARIETCLLYTSPSPRD